MSIHEYDQKYRSMQKSIENADISAKNKELILNFAGDLLLQNLSKGRILKYVSNTKTLALNLHKDFDIATMEDVKKYVTKIQQREDYTAWTKKEYKLLIRKFFKWLYQTPGKEFPPIVSWISIHMSRCQEHLPSEGELLTEGDIEKLLKAADHPRDKALVAMLWESGARIGEIGNLRVRNICFDKHGMVIAVQGKTGSRKIRLISSTPFVSTWLNNHPQQGNPDAPVWINIGTTKHHSPMKYGCIRAVFIRLFAKAGIQKRTNPHIFRHSRATFLANHLTEFQMNQYFGWIQGSDMPSTYVHMSGREVDKAILALNGIKIETKQEESKFQPRICPRCDTINSADSKHCNKCGGVLDLKYAMEMEEKQQQELSERKKKDSILSELLNDTDVQEFLLHKIRQRSIASG